MSRRLATPLLLAALALTGCGTGSSAPAADAKASPGALALPEVTSASFEKALGERWKLTYRDMPGADGRRMGNGATGEGLRVGVVETRGPAGMESLACQAFGKRAEAARRFLLACADAAGTAPQSVRDWLTAHADRVSSGSGHAISHGAVDYHLGINKDQGVRVLYISPGQGLGG